MPPSKAAARLPDETDDVAILARPLDLDLERVEG
jgi:hypothetical protein